MQGQKLQFARIVPYLGHITVSFTEAMPVGEADNCLGCNILIVHCIHRGGQY